MSEQPVASVSVGLLLHNQPASTPEERPSAAGERLVNQEKGHLAVSPTITFTLLPFMTSLTSVWKSCRGRRPPGAAAFSPFSPRVGSLDFTALSAGTQTPQGHRLCSPLRCLTEEVGRGEKKNQLLWLERLVLETCSLFPKSFQWR